MAQIRKRPRSNVDLPTNLLAAIGHVTALWAKLEYTIDLSINEILALPGAPAVNPRLVQPFNKRLELLATLCDQFLTNPKNRKSAAKIVADLKQLVGMRNLIVHGAVGHPGQRRKRPGVYWFRRISWDRQPRVKERRALTVAAVEAFAARLSDAYAYSTMLEVYFWPVQRA
jgi:hypothetical protein